jgi:uncharacterized protein involved in outer membrane biogenesis
MRRLRTFRWLLLLAGVLIVLLAAVAAVLLSLDLSPYRSRLAFLLGNTLGREVTLGGKVSIVPALHPILRVERASIAAPDWATHPALAQAQWLEIRFGLPELLLGRLRIVGIVLERAAVHLETRADGANNWMRAPPGPAPIDPAARETEQDAAQDAAQRAVRPSPMRALPGILVRRSEVSFRNGASGLVTRLEVIRAHLEALEDAPLSLRVVGRVQGQPITLAVRGGPVALLLAGDRTWPLTVKLTSLATTLAAEGELALLPRPRFDLETTLWGSDLTTLNRLGAVLLPPLGPFRLMARLSLDARGYAAADLRGELGSPVDHSRFRLTSGGIRAPFRKPLEIDIDGVFRELPFVLSMRGGPYPSLVAGAEPWPVEAKLRGARSSLRVLGSLTGAQGKSFDLTVSTSGGDLSSLSPLVARPLPALGPYSIQARLQRTPGGLRVSELRSRLGESDLSGSLAWESGGPRPRLTARLRAETLRRDDLLPSPSSRVWQEREVPGTWLEAVDADLVLSVGRAVGLGPAVEDITLSARLEAGRLTVRPLRAKLAGSPLEGTLSGEVSGGMLRASAEVRATTLDLGRMLGALGFAPGVDAWAAALELRLAGEGETPRRLLEGARLDLVVSGARIAVSGADPGGARAVESVRARLQGMAGEPFSLRLQGRYRGQPAELELRATPPVAGEASDAPWGMQGGGHIGGIAWHAGGRLGRPFTPGWLAFGVEAEGDSLALLGPLLGTRLPPLGPFRLEGRLGDSLRGYRLSSLEGRLGDSDFSGEARLVSAGERQRLVLKLASRRLHWRDLRPPGPAAIAGGPPEGGTPSSWLDRPLPREALAAMDVLLDYRAERVLVGDTTLEALALKADLVNGVFRLQPFHLTLWDGAVVAEARLDTTAPNPAYRLSVAGHRLAYAAALGKGPFAPEEGKADLVLELRGRGATARQLLASSEGTAGLLGGPGHLENKYLRLWASDLFLAMVPSFGERPVTPLRCAVARFEVKDGLAETHSILVDTERLVIKGIGTVRLASREIDFLLWPEARDRSLISVTTPVKVTGTLASPSVTPQISGVAHDTAWIFIGANNPIVLALRMLVPGPAEDTPCVAALSTDPQTPSPKPNEPPTVLSRTGDFFQGLWKMMKGAVGAE